MTERTVLCVGETMGLLTPTSDLRTEPLLHVHQAGAESNVAAGLAHLGVRSRWLSRVGDDDFGAIITDFLAARGVDTSAVVVDPERPTGLMVKTVRDGQTSVRYARAGSAASRLSVADLTRDALAGVGIIHLSGITPALSESTDRLAEAVLVERVVDPLARREVVVSFDVNHRARLWTDRAAAPRLQRLARAADIVLVGLDEAQDLWGCRTPEDVRDLLPEPARLVVKDGAVAAHEFVRGRSGDHRLTVPALHADVVEVVGAGDAYAAGYLAGLTTPTSPESAPTSPELVEGLASTSPESTPTSPELTPTSPELVEGPARHALRLGHVLAACTIQSPLDLPAWPTADRLRQWAELDEAGWQGLRITPDVLTTGKESADDRTPDRS